MLLMDMGFTERKTMLTKMHSATFKSKETMVA
nr:MAG TPA: UBA domain protein [Caudoviricetes sp.]